jgi:starvation-inducible DNA-binding protein
MFLQFHQLFKLIYDDAYGSVDTFAENLRKLGTFAPGSLSRFNMLSKVEDETDILPANAMVKELLMDSEKMIIILKKTYDASEAEGKHGFSDFLAERMDAHEKHNWMLRSTLEG